MPLSPELKSLIVKKFKVESVDTVADLGKALRRACIYSECVSNQEWNDHIEVVYALASELFRVDSGELFRPNTQGYNALQCAIKSLMDYSKTKTPESINIINRMRLLGEVARFIVPEHLNQDEFLKQYVSDKYKDDSELIFVDLLNNPKIIPEVDLCIYAAKEILSAFKHSKVAFNELIKLSESNMAEIAKLPPPLILLTDHGDIATASFFEKHSAELSRNGYNLLCVEMAHSQLVDEFINLDLSNIKFRNRKISLNPASIEKFKIIKHSIKSMQNAGASIEFIDILPAEAPKLLTYGYMIERYRLLRIIEEQRDISMTYYSHASSIKHKTGAVIVVGINHYDNLLNYFTQMMHIKPIFALITRDLDVLKRKGQAGAAVNPNFIQDFMTQGVKVIDMSKGDFNLKELIGVDQVQRAFSSMRLKQ